MLHVKVKKRDYYVKFTEDTSPNKGGYYCQVYGDSEGWGKELDSFTIQNTAIPKSITDKAQRLARAEKIADEKVKMRF